VGVRKSREYRRRNNHLCGECHKELRAEHGRRWRHEHALDKRRYKARRRATQESR